MKSVFLDQFKNLKASGGSLMKLYGDVLLVEGHAPEEAKTASGIIIQSHDRQRNGFGENLPAFYTVLYAGEGFYDEETGEDVPLDIEPGAIILTGTQSVRPISKFGPIISTKESGLFLTRVQDIQASFGGPAAYEQAMDLLRSKSNVQ